MRKKYLHIICHIVFLAGFLLGTPNFVYAQNIYFSQYQNTPMLTNPAMIATDDWVNVNLMYRVQSIGGGQAFTTPMLSASYPLIRESDGHRWAGLGMNIISDNAGINSLVKTTGGAAAFAYSIEANKLNKISKYIRFRRLNYLSFGVKLGFFSTRINTEQLTFGSQWNGFVSTPSPPADEIAAITKPTVNYPTADLGIYYHLEDTLFRNRAYLGLAAKQLNQPKINFTDFGKPLPLTFVLTGGIRVLQTYHYSIMPNFRIINQGAINQINVGSAFRYHFDRRFEEKRTQGGYSEATIGLNIWYSVKNALIAGIELQNHNYSVTFSYDFVMSNPENTGAASSNTEFSVGFRKYFGGKRKVPVETLTNNTETEPVLPQVDTTKLAEGDSSEYENPRKRGLTEDQVNIFQRAILFPYNDWELNEAQRLYLDRFAALLESRPDLVIEIGGHSCNIGEADYRKSISQIRAINVYDYLISKGVDKKRLLARGFSDNRPISENIFDAARVRNRRVEFRLVKEDANKKGDD
jgi:type IX secretion system PorP/SprF family membrane protein